MTPTLYGRWQTRWFLLIVVGFPVTWFLIDVGLIAAGDSDRSIYYGILIYLGLFGLGWDTLYNYLQKFMWDRDWPGLFQFFAAIAEGIVLFLILPVLQAIQVPFTTRTRVELSVFAVQYTIVSVAIYLSAWVLMRLLFPRWRFRGGEWMGKWPK